METIKSYKNLTKKGYLVIERDENEKLSQLREFFRFDSKAPIF